MSLAGTTSNFRHRVYSARERNAKFAKRPRRTNRSGIGSKRRWVIYLRERGACAYCQRQLRWRDSTVDHLIPHILYGTRSYPNLVLSCVECNKDKRSLLPLEYMAVREGW